MSASPVAASISLISFLRISCTAVRMVMRCGGHAGLGALKLIVVERVVLGLGRHAAVESDDLKHLALDKLVRLAPISHCSMLSNAANPLLHIGWLASAQNCNVHVARQRQRTLDHLRAATELALPLLLELCGASGIDLGRILCAMTLEYERLPVNSAPMKPSGSAGAVSSSCSSSGMTISRPCLGCGRELSAWGENMSCCNEGQQGATLRISSRSACWRRSPASLSGVMNEALLSELMLSLSRTGVAPGVAPNPRGVKPPGVLEPARWSATRNTDLLFARPSAASRCGVDSTTFGVAIVLRDGVMPSKLPPPS